MIDSNIHVKQMSRIENKREAGIKFLLIRNVKQMELNWGKIYPGF
jgi:hypothetical protein